MDNNTEVFEVSPEEIGSVFAERTNLTADEAFTYYVVGAAFDAFFPWHRQSNRRDC